MADDNVRLSAGTDDGVIVAGDVLTYAGDTALIQLQRLVHVIGAEGAHTLVEIVYAEDDATPSTIYGMAGMMERDDALASLTPAAGDWVGMRSSAEGALWTQDFNSDAILSDTTAIKAAVEGTLTVGAHAVTNAGTFATQATLQAGTAEIGKLAAGTAEIGNVKNSGTFAIQIVDPSFAVADGNALGEGVLVQGDDGTDRKNIHVNATTGDVQVDVTNTVTVDLGANNDVIATGNIAHSATDSGNPIKLGAKAIAHGANPTAVLAAERTDLYANRAGIPFMIGGHPNVVTREYRATTTRTNDDMLGAISAGTKYVITAYTVTCDNANSTDLGVRIGFGATAVPSEPADGAGVDGVLMSHPGIAAGSGVAKGDGSGILAVGGDGHELRITTDAAKTVKVIITYYTIES